MHSVIPVNCVTQSPRQSYPHEKERNIVSAIFCAILIVLMIVALALPNWYYLKEGDCLQHGIGTEQFFYTDTMKPIPVPIIPKNYSHATLVYFGLNDDMKSCVTPEIAKVQRLIIGLCFVTIFFSFYQFYFDVTGVKNPILNCTRRYGLGSIFSVILIVIIIGLCYYTSDLMEQRQERIKSFRPIKVEVTFGVSYYLIATAGVVAIIATASNLINCDHMNRNESGPILLDDQQEETFSIALPHSQSWQYVHEMNGASRGSVPPPPYTP